MGKPTKNQIAPIVGSLMNGHFRARIKIRSKYMPHQGKQECERRREQISKALWLATAA